MRHEHPGALRLDCLTATRRFFARCVASVDPSRESLWIAHVDEVRDCLHVARYPGDETSAPFPIKEIISDALRHESAGILLAHNHPGGRTYPSMMDIRATRDLATV